MDDEQCSPIKPKKRTSEDSPFKKRNFDSVEVSNNGNYEIKNDQPRIIISSQDESKCEISVGGFGVELDHRREND